MFGIFLSTFGCYEWCCCEYLPRRLSVDTFFFFISLGYISLWVVLLGYMVILCLTTFWGTTSIFSTADAPFYCLSRYICAYVGSSFSTSSSKLVISFLSFSFSCILASVERYIYVFLSNIFVICVFSYLIALDRISRTSLNGSSKKRHLFVPDCRGNVHLSALSLILGVDFSFFSFFFFFLFIFFFSFYFFFFFFFIFPL